MLLEPFRVLYNIHTTSMWPYHVKNVTSSHAYEPFLMIKGALWLTEGEAATRDVLLKKVLLKFLQNSQENRVSFLIKFQARPASNCIKKETLAQAFYCEFCEILKNTFFTEHHWATTSAEASLGPCQTFMTELFFLKIFFSEK